VGFLMSQQSCPGPGESISSPTFKVGSIGTVQSNRGFSSSDHARASPELATFRYVKLPLSRARSKRLLDTVALISPFEHRKCSDTRCFYPRRLAKMLHAPR